MSVSIDGLFNAVKTALEAYEAVTDAVTVIAGSLSDDDQAELQRRVAELRAQNDAARARRHAALSEAARK